MSAPEDPWDSKLARLRAAAEEEMRRRLPGGPPAKRFKNGSGGSRGGDGGDCGEPASAGAALGGRFDYGAIKELATGSLNGFLLTCPLQRENSARKEAVPLLQRYLQRCSTPAHGGNSTDLPTTAEAANAAAADAAVSAAEIEAGAAGAAPEDGAEGATPAALQQPAAAPAGGSLAAIKVACRGVVAFKLAAAAADSGSAADPAAASEGGADDERHSAAPAAASAASAALLVQQAAALLLADIESGKQARLTHVQRIIPMQTTCRLEAGAVKAAGGRLAALVAAANNGAEGPAGGVGAAAAEPAAAAAGDGEAAQPPRRKVTFGIALKQRALEGAKAAPAPGKEAGAGDPPAAAAGGETATTTAGGETAASDAHASGSSAPSGSEGKPMDRGGIISALAAGFESALRQHHCCEVAVDLKSPQWVLVVEVVPAAGALYAALCALPAGLCVLKPKLHIKPVGHGAK